MLPPYDDNKKSKGLAARRATLAWRTVCWEWSIGWLKRGVISTHTHIPYQ